LHTPLSAEERSRLAEQYLDSLPFTPYQVQEDGLLAWFTSEQGVLVCAPTGTGKTLIAEAALFEALHSGREAYYTTPLIALTEQKFNEIQEAAVRWGFTPNHVGLVTGHRKINPHAPVLVVVAEILLNRLMQPGEFDFSNVSAVVMDEFHSFADPERGVVWELSLARLPSHVRLLLLSATVGNASEFLYWLKKNHGRLLERVEGNERRVPLNFHWVEDALLNEHIEFMVKGTPDERKTPALVFCFNRDECWNVAEQLKGLDLLGPGEREPLNAAVEALDWTQGVGPKLRQMLRRGVGVHHAGLLPKYRRVVEDLFERKLLAVAVCTETLASGVNLPARSVVLPSLVKGPKDGKKLIDASSAHQIFGRAGRPQFDKEGFVFVLAHEDDVKIKRWKEKFDAIPENTKDLGLLQARKALKKKQPTRRATETYWTQPQFDKLRAAPPGKLYSKGPVPWRLLAHMIAVDPNVEPIRDVVRKRLLDSPRIEAQLKHLDFMLLTLHRGGFVRLEPEPPPPPSATEDASAPQLSAVAYSSERAVPLDKLRMLLAFRTIHPVYGAFLIEQLATADRNEKLQALESTLEIPRSVLRYVRPPAKDELPAGPLEAKLDPELLTRGLIAAPIPPGEEEDDDGDYGGGWEERPPAFAEKLRLWFDVQFPQIDDVNTQAVWAAGELLRFSGDFNKYIRTRDLTKQEGVIFRHLLRMILLCEEIARVPPAEIWPADWQREFQGIASQIAESCRVVDPESTDQVINEADADLEAPKIQTEGVTT
jgi:superfamily II DNA/RNA helicase